MSISLKPFQQQSVQAAVEGLQRASGRRRFLVADEVGLGKTMVARGVIETMLQAEPSLCVFYLANGSRVGSQNAIRLMPGQAKPSTVDRLGLLHQQPRSRSSGIRLYTFTPETSFRIRGTGRWEERAFLQELVQLAYGAGAMRQINGAQSFAGVKRDWTTNQRKYVERHNPSPRLIAQFRRVLRDQYGLARGVAPITEILRRSGGRPLVPLRRALAEAELRSHAPHLVLCDEFQTYRELLLHAESETSAQPEKRLMKQLLTGREERPPCVLLLSATPFRLFASRWEEAMLPEASEQLFDVLRFLGGKLLSDRARTMFRSFNIALSNFAHANEDRWSECHTVAATLQLQLEILLRPVLCRNERPQPPYQPSPELQPGAIESLLPADMASFRHLGFALGASVGGRFRHEAVAFWASVPLAMQTLGPSYKAWSEAKRDGLLHAKRLGPHLTKASRSGSSEALTAHPKLRSLRKIYSPAAAALPWVAPSLHWWELGPAWRASPASSTQEEASGGPTKLLLFSRFRAAPQSIAALTSLAVESDIHLTKAGDGYASRTRRRPFKLSPSSMNTFALFHPSPWLIDLTEPLAAGSGKWEMVVATVESQLRAELKRFNIPITRKAPPRAFWKLLAGLERRSGAAQRVQSAWSVAASPSASDTVLKRVLARWRDDAAEIATVSRAELNALVRFALEAPGIVVGRAFRRHYDRVLQDNLAALTRLSWFGFAAYLGDPVFLPKGRKAGRPADTIRQWVREGCLESVLDEHLCYSKGNDPAGAISDMEQALQMHAGSVKVYAARAGGKATDFRVRCHTAVPFGGNDYEDSSESTPGDPKPSRSDALRVAFNSPFRPFLLATTSVGQEGLDFHPWCRDIAHWDLCSSPLDLEQREGRIQRYLGLAVRRRLAERFREQAVRAASGTSPWDRIMEAAEVDAHDSTDGMSPWWVTPGGEIRRHLFFMEGSRDVASYSRLKKLRALYRLALGQPNQEDFLETLSATSPMRLQALQRLTLRLAPGHTKPHA